MTSTKVILARGGFSLVEVLSEPDHKVVGYAVLGPDGGAVGGSFESYGDALEAFLSYVEDNDDDDEPSSSPSFRP